MRLNEGLAVLAVDRLLGRPTVKTDTLDVVARSASGEPIRRVNSVNEKNQDAVVALDIRGYWIARYLEEVQPGQLESLFARPRRHAEVEGQIANTLGMSGVTQHLRCRVDRLVGRGPEEEDEPRTVRPATISLDGMY